MNSPLLIKVALHFYYSPEPWPDQSPVFDICVETLIEAGMLTRYEGGLIQRNEAALKVYAEALMNVPFPEQKWIIPQP
jgi:hypothetical protein